MNMEHIGIALEIMGKRLWAEFLRPFIIIMPRVMVLGRNYRKDRKDHERTVKD